MTAGRLGKARAGQGTTRKARQGKARQDQHMTGEHTTGNWHRTLSLWFYWWIATNLFRCIPPPTVPGCATSGCHVLCIVINCNKKNRKKLNQHYILASNPIYLRKLNRALLHSHIFSSAPKIPILVPIHISYLA